MARGRIPDSDIAAIRERTPIEEIVAEYVQLKPGGADSMKGLSPFKDERTPSFHVRPNHGYYHCFSTGKGGDVFSFLMEMEHLTFPEAVEACAERIGYRINYEGGGTGRREEPGTRQRLIAANREAQKFYSMQLGKPEAETARTFLTDRGFTMEQAKHFGCGYAPAGWDTLTKHLQRLGFSFEELEKAGLARMGRKGPIDRFHRRLLWPIRNISGDVIGFGARKLYDDDNLGKYMNTPETMLYKKSKVLFGLDHAKKSIAEEHRAVIVEGYTDVMAMHAAGVTTAVAACGTAFGDEHLQLLRRLMLDDSFFRGELIYTFDGDEAGQKAAMRAFEGEQQFTGQSYVAVAPEGMDPCDLRMERGDAAVRDLVAQRTPLVEFVLRTLLSDYDMTTPNGRVEGLRRVVPVLGQIRDAALRDEYAREVAGWVGWNDEAELVRRVRDEARNPSRADGPRRRPFRKRDEDEYTGPGSPGFGGGAAAAGGGAPGGGAARPLLPYPDPRDPELHVQREAMKLAIQEPVITGPMFDALSPDTFPHPTYRALFDATQKAGGVASQSGGAPWVTALLGQLDDAVGRALVTELGVEEIRVDAEQLRAYSSSVLARLQEVWVGGQVAQVKSMLARMRPADDEAAYRQMFADLLALEDYRRELLAESLKVQVD
ncbi:MULTISPECIES: DNA primase [Corynebacterium]|uniref:DNA primase n=1 Tax=Corynebacterium freneyi TaxID=134034 RepID=A0ABS4U635_9CORY|nr:MULTISPECIES: DNA primase [Corynebacterium]MBP2332129.1 DNA primase [Corynebacterium freneyi]MCG7440063.1 DNA primase [Corynebacterium freneyi]QXA53645.1 DNA primase [Corynebacterium freneyi]UBI01691.1 DNA primase [Corynebacterium freneyi]